MDREKLVLWKGDSVVPLTPRALGVLSVLIEAGGDVVTKTALLARAWPDVIVEEANLSVTVAALRKVLDAGSTGPSCIETIPRRGYRFAAPLRTARQPQRVVLAVLPFSSLSGEGDRPLGLGMADALIVRLTGTEGLVVRPTGAVAQYAEKPHSPEDVARELGADAVVEGTVLRQGTRLRVSSRLIPRTGTLQHWAGHFDAEMADIFSVQDEVASRIADVLCARLLPMTAVPGAPSHVPRIEAYEHCLRGRYFWAELTPSNMATAVRSFQKAASLDPAWAAPHVGLADAHILFAFAGALPAKSALDLAVASADRAIDRDPVLPEAHVTRGFLALLREGRAEAARRALDHAIDLAPAARGLRQWRGLLFALLGDLDAARSEIALAREADPLSALANALAALVHETAGEFDAEADLARQAVELRPDRFLGHWSLGVALVLGGHGAEGVAALRKAVELSGRIPIMKSVLAWGLAAAGETAEARSLLPELEGWSPVSAYRRAAVYLALGDESQALARLEESAASADPWFVYLRMDPIFAPLRPNPRMADLIARRFGHG